MLCGGMNCIRLSLDEWERDLYLSYLIQKAIRSSFVSDSIPKCHRLVLQFSFSNRSNG
jgi:hypothetical protein